MSRARSGASSSAAGLRSSSPSAKASFAHYNVLVADDDRVIVEIVSQLVAKRFQSNVRCVGDGDSVINALSEAPFDILVTDMRMPGLCGLELIAQVREHFPQTDIVVVTGITESFPYVKVIEAGAHDFIAKPFPNEELVAKLLRIFHERELLRARAIAEVKYRGLFEVNTDSMVFIDADKQRITDANRAFCIMYGAAEQDILGRPIIELVGPEEHERFVEGMHMCSQNGQGTLGDVPLKCPDGQTRLLDMTVSVLRVGPDEIACLSFKDTTEQRAMEARLLEAARLDSLTGLHNKRALNISLDMAVARARNEHSVFTLVFVDVDNFKECNDRHGHQTGDKLLKRIGQIILQSVRGRHDEGFRYGGDEFAILLDADLSIATQVAERMRTKLEQVENFGTSISIGVTEFRQGMTAEQVTEAADRALYCAKSKGKNMLWIG